MSNGSVRGIVLAHGSLAEGFTDAVRQIAGSAADSLIPLTNRGLSPDALADLVRQHAGDGRTIVFTDLPSGSCGFAARRISSQSENLVVVTGVNLPMLLEFVVHHDMSMEELVPRLLAKGRGTVSCAPASLENHGHRAVSGG